MIVTRMTRQHLVATAVATLLLLLGAAGTASAQEADGSTFTIPVNVEHGASGKPVKDTAVILRASRPKGPFEPKEPEPKHEFVGETNQEGVAHFSQVPTSLLSTGLELYAVVTYGGIPFKSNRVAPSKAAHLSIDVYEKAQSADVLKVKQLQTVAQPWEGNLYFTQFWTLTVEGNQALDTSVLPGDEFSKGLPIVLPLKAKNINVNGPGETEVVDSTVHWTGTISPNETVNLQMRFRMTASSPSFVFEQSTDYPVEKVAVAVPLETKSEKIPRLDNVTLAAKGFESVEVTSNPPNLRPGKEYLYASGRSLKKSESYAVKISGLPFDQPITPWIFLGLGIAGIGFVFFFARREIGWTETEKGRQTALETLRAEREELLDELALIEQAWRDGDIDEIDYETETLRLRERLALVVRKINELQGS